MDNKLRLPIRKFESTDEVLANTNFKKVKICIMHTGENLNGSVFSLDSINDSIDTLANIPILAFVEKTDGQDNKDFAGHETDLDIFTDKDGTIKVREYYKEVPIGVIPESNEYFFEEKDGETYLGCYGYIWKCYSNDAYDILEEDQEKEVSMEIYINNCSYDRKQRCNINKFEFLGVTILGARYPGAMGEDCVLSMNFSKEDSEYKEYLSSVEKLNKLLKCQREEGLSVDVNKETSTVENKEEFAEENKDEEVCPTCGKNPCECKKENHAVNDDEEDKADDKVDDDEEDKDKDKEDESCKKKNHATEDKTDDDKKDDKEDDKSDDDKDEEDDDDKSDEEDKDKENESCKKKNHTVEDDKADFGLSLNNTFKAIRKQLESYTYEYVSYWGDTYTWRKYYVVELIPEDSVVVIEDEEENEFYGITYSINNDDVTLDLDNKVLYIQEWRAKETSSARFENTDKKEKYTTKNEVYQAVGKELKELRQFKADIEAQEEKAQFDEKVNNILSQFEFSEEETSDLVEKVYNKSINLDMFETCLFALEAKKNRAEKEKFAKIEKENSLNIVDSKKEEQAKPKSRFDYLLKEFGNKNK